MTKVEHAKALAASGFHVFPLLVNGKTPVELGKYLSVATQKPEYIELLWRNELLNDYFDYNIGIATDLYQDDKSLVVIDIDVKAGARGFETVRKLKAEGKTLPPTFTVKTASGGLHFYYWAEKPIRQGAKIFGDGFDIRSAGGLVVAPGSTINDKVYHVISDQELAPCPQWIIDAREIQPSTEAQKPEVVEADDKRISQYIEKHASKATMGELKDVAYKVIARIKDFGCPEDEALHYGLKWRDLKAPELEDDSLEFIVSCVYKYGKRPIGADDPVHDFNDDVEETGLEKKNQNPVLAFNENYAFALENGSAVILHETTDESGRFDLRRIKIDAFRMRFAPEEILVGERYKPAVDVWLKHPERRTYDEVGFYPGRDMPSNIYNLWRGYTVEPLGIEEKPTSPMVSGLQAFEEHIFENICGSDKNHFDWVMSYFAHLVQKPWDKPLVAIVLKGGKGVGKDTPINIVGNLIDRHYIMASDSRYFVGNFNGHLEHCLLIALNEAFWSGDKKADAILKHLITGEKQIIERKGQEVKNVKNFVRVVIVGNESWLVPASLDERRFAVFEVGDKRKQDVRFFSKMKQDMEAGGYRYLLRKLLDYKICKSLNIAPRTHALMDQIKQSLNGFEMWWLACITEGEILGLDFSRGWPKLISTNELRAACRNYLKENNARFRLSPEMFGRKMKQFANADKFRASTDGDRFWAYGLPPISECRTIWEKQASLSEQWVDEDEVEALAELGL